MSHCNPGFNFYPYRLVLRTGIYFGAGTPYGLFLLSHGGTLCLKYQQKN